MPAPLQARADVADDDARALCRHARAQSRARCRARAPVTMATLLETMPGIMLGMSSRRVTSASESRRRDRMRGARAGSVSTGSDSTSPRAFRRRDALRGTALALRLSPTPRRQAPRSSAASPIARPRRACCLPRSRRSRIAGESAELVDVDEFRGLVDAALELVAAFELRRSWW